MPRYYFGKQKHNMDKNGEVHFKDWFKGMARHPIYGFGLLKNVEVFENKGIAKLKNRFTVDTNITPEALVEETACLLEDKARVSFL